MSARSANLPAYLFWLSLVAAPSCADLAAAPAVDAAPSPAPPSSAPSPSPAPGARVPPWLPVDASFAGCEGG